MEKLKEKWTEMPEWKKACTIVIGLIQISLLIAALVDIRKRSAQDIRGDKKVWFLVSFINFIGPILYFKIGRKKQTN